MTIATNAVQDGQPHIGNKAVPNTQTLTVTLPYVADIVSLYADVAGCVLHYHGSAGAEFKVPLIAGTYTAFYGRFVTLYVTNGSGGAAQVAWNAAQTRIDGADYDALTGEGITTHANVTVA